MGSTGMMMTDHPERPTASTLGGRRAVRCTPRRSGRSPALPYPPQCGSRIPEGVGAGHEPGFGFGNTAKRCSIDMTEAWLPLGALSSTQRIGYVTCNS